MPSVGASELLGQVVITAEVGLGDGTRRLGRFKQTEWRETGLFLTSRAQRLLERSLNRRFGHGGPDDYVPASDRWKLDLVEKLTVFELAEERDGGNVTISEIQDALVARGRPQLKLGGVS